MIFGRAFLDGIIFSILFGGMITIMEAINPRLQLHNYPASIRKTVAPKTYAEQKRFKMLAIPMVIVLLIYFVGTVVQTYSKVEPNYLTLFFHSFIMVMLWNAFDLLIMDWLIFCTITPKFIVIPGTEGNPSYKDYKYHINGSFGKGLMLAIIIATFFAGVVFVILRIFF